jgi:hypothetical protein
MSWVSVRLAADSGQDADLGCSGPHVWPPLGHVHKPGLGQLQSSKQLADLRRAARDRRSGRVLVGLADLCEHPLIGAVRRYVGDHQVATRRNLPAQSGCDLTGGFPRRG